MKKISDQLIYSPSDISNFIHCRHLTSLDKEALDGFRDRPNYTNKVMLALREKGQQFEAAFLETLREQGKSISVIEPGDPEAYAKTLQAIRAGIEVIYQARLGKEKEWWGWSDFLFRVDQPSELGDFSYEVMDTKLATETKAATIIQISLYSEALAEIQGKLPEMMWVKTPEEQIGYRVSEYAAYVRLVKKRFLQAIQETESASYPEPVSHCDICTWWEVCNQRRRQDDHLSFVAGMGRTQIKEVAHHGIETMDMFAQVESPIPFKPSRGALQTYQKLRDQANIQWRSRNENYRPIHELLELQPDKGFFNLPEPSPFDVYLDLEGDPLVEPGGLEYLIGWVYQGEYHAIWSSTEAEEKEAFESFITQVMQLKAEHPKMHIYHYAPYEVSAFKRLMGKYATCEDEVDGLLRSGTFIDLYGVVRQAVRASVEKYSIKDLEKFYGYVREIDLREVSKHKSMYEFLLETKKTGEATEEMLDAIRLYNQDDCVSTERLHQWLEELRLQAINEGAEIPRPEAKSMEAREDITAHQERIKPLMDTLLAGIPVSIAERTPEQQGRYILANMLDWYRREEKSVWWEYYRLLELTPEELLEEKNAISFLQYTGNNFAEKKSTVYEYRFPLQEAEFMKDKSVNNQERKSAGTIFHLDMNQGIIQLKKGPSFNHDEHPSSVFLLDRVPYKVKEEAIIGLAEWVVQNGLDSESEEFRAVRSLLLRNHPQLVNPVDDQTDFLELTKDWAEKLDHSYLPIQGPPGSGKSFTASRMIMHLILQGKKVGVTAMSHKVITSLVDKVWNLFLNSNHTIQAIQMVKKEEDLNAYPWEAINDTAKAIRGAVNANLIAGTPFFWANEALIDSVDYLVIDEAGQLSLIDTLACGTAAKNLILLGDPQQLQQPQQGVHPEGTEVSALSHILQQQQTISREQGIFLAKTWRMHPAICAFDSEQFYEEKLHTVPGLENQEILGNTRFAGSGLRFVPVSHQGNTNSAPEEVSRIVQLVGDLSNGQVMIRDSDGREKVLQRSDIKIISPYNAQVGLLKEALPDVEIGTVDKFQGQEAPVVIYSVATSSPEDAPRGMEFLYSPNRFNVAVSRAKALFVLVASPSVLEPDCKSPAQIKLANPFCRFVELAEVIS
jgi:predicted RecB family nuclease